MYYSTTGNSTKINQQWNPVGYVQHLRYGNDWTNNVHPETQFVTDAAGCTSGTNCSLPAISWVVPDGANSEHPPNIVQTGEQWTQTQVNALLSNPYLWNNTVMFVTWDDHGGFYDHLPPTQDAFGWTNGMRVPLLCIGRYCLNQITTTTFTFASLLKCVENNFGVSYLVSSVDGAANDVCFSTGGMMSLNQNNPFPGGLTSTSVMSSLNPSVFGQSVTFTATVIPKTYGSPTGTVTFSNGSTPLGMVPLTAGNAILTTTAVPAGSQIITAAYSGDSYFSGSSASLTQAVNLATTTLILTTSANPSTYNQSVTLTATITPQYGGQVSGSVNFSDGITLLGTAMLSGNVAILTTNTLAPGGHSITASYSGSSNFMGSSGALNQIVNQATTTTTLVSSVNPSQVSQPVTFTGTITPQYGGQVTGSMAFKDGGTPIGNSTVNNDTAALTITNLTLATHSITASYSGDTNFLSSTSNSVSQVVTLDATTTTLASSSNPSVSGKSVTLTSTISSSWNPPTGKVEFLDGSTVLATTTVKSGVATYSTSKLPTGSNILTAVYLGDSNNNGSTSPSLNQFVLAATSTSLTSTPNPSVYQQSVTFAAAVTSSLGPPPNGELITFTQGSTTLGTAPIESGVASFLYSGLAVGTKSVKATYPGDAVFATSTSSADSQVVNKATSSTTITSSLNPSTYGQSVTFTATVSPQFGGVPTGTVEFDDGSTKLKTVTLSNGVASYTTSTLSQGSHTISANYSGNSSFTLSSSSLDQTVQ
jgi:hypothetical protein